jgi:hypothetical protein
VPDPEASSVPVERRGAVAMAGALSTRIAWLAIALAIALGSAGLVAYLDHEPGTPARAELTWRGDQQIEPALDTALDRLRAIDGELERLSDVAKDAIVAMVGRDRARLARLVDEGTTLITGIDRDAASLRSELAVLPGMGPNEGLRLSEAALARQAALVAAVDETRGLLELWARLEIGAQQSTVLIQTLEQHDAAVVAATDDGRGRRYTAALRDIDRADGFMAAAKRQATQLRNTTDVATLTEWLLRAEAYDQALRRLYAALRSSGGRVTAEVRAAFAAEQATRERLPDTENPLVIVMNDIAQAGANDVAIAIETARGALEEAILEVEALDPAASGAPTASFDPTASFEPTASFAPSA